VTYFSKRDAEEFRAKRHQDLLSRRIVTFVEARAAEIENADPDGAAKSRKVLDDCCDRVDATQFGHHPPRYLRGEVNNMRLLKLLARNWADHPDFLPEWKTP
jgi:hypothetical protein